MNRATINETEIMPGTAFFDVSLTISQSCFYLLSAFIFLHERHLSLGSMKEACFDQFTINNKYLSSHT